jgi:hypothetical protein
LRRFRPADGGRDNELLSPAESVIVWRCQDCGGVDAPQPCIDVCIWGPADWVDAGSYESGRSRAAVDREVEQSLAGLLRRFASATPREGQWERSGRAFQSQARLVLRSGEPRRVADERSLRPGVGKPAGLTQPLHLRRIAGQGNDQGCPLARRVRAKDNRELVPLVKRGTS